VLDQAQLGELQQDPPDPGMVEADRCGSEVADGVVGPPLLELWAGLGQRRYQLDAASFHTGNRHRDHDVRSARFLDADRCPSMTFASTQLERSGGLTLVGTLSVRNVARPLSLMIERYTVAPASPCSLEVWASTRIDRTGFGLTAAKGMAGRHLDVSLRILGVRR
jgi:polyisoprenoid-binding protein YceI